MDLYIFQQINFWAGKFFWLDCLAIFLAEYLGYILIAVFFFILLRKKNLEIGIIGFFAVVLSRLGITEIIRVIWSRSRPFVENKVNLLLNHPDTASFPSGHSSFFFALSAVVYLYNKKAGIFFFIASFLMGISRVFCGIHWPSDILAGAIVGILSGWLVYRICLPHRLPHKLLYRLSHRLSHRLPHK
ncbi:MAG: phosphatase PAP2 family protein [Patescibacteria group bacterium]|nr:phosphatase PAP2 family protein [Patescibacteria group bacterium]